MKPTFVILAAGLGTRMKSKRAKVLHRAGGLALVEHVVRSALGVTDPDRVVVVLGHQADQVREVLKPYGVRDAIQTEQRGTGHAVAAAKSALAGMGGPVVIAYGDCPLLTTATFRGLIEAQAQSGKAATLVTTELQDPTGYGRVILDPDGDVAMIIEQKSCTPEQLLMRFINSGIYCYDPDALWSHIDEITPNRETGELFLTDMPEILARAGLKVAPYTIPDPSQLIGINTRVELAVVDRILRERKTRELMTNGVTIEYPDTVTVDPDVEVGPDTVIEAFARLLGRTRIGSECRVGSCSIVSNTTVADGVEIFPFTHIDACTIETGAQIGPYARLRMNAVVETGAHIGNFVELKKTRLGAGAKSMHLAYLGDSKIGAKSNIGAGTITCNYDGVNKHATVVGDNAFIGSNSTLVAPVEIGAGAYVGAGSVVTDPVPDDALALGRGRQVVKEGWAAKRRASVSKKPS